jgi:hypothetical protein
VSLEIDQYRAVDPALTQGKIIDTQDSGRGQSRSGGTADNAQHGIATDGHAQAGSRAGAGFATGLAAKDTHGFSQAHGALGMESSQVGQAFDKGLPRARGCQAAKAAYEQT